MIGMSMSAAPRVAISQRRAFLHAGAHDALDRRWAPFLWACGAVPLPMPTLHEGSDRWLEAVRPAAVVFSGGDDPGQDAERDITEASALLWADVRRRPVIGVCRGLQILVRVSGGHLERVANHVGRHRIFSEEGAREVNSYHRWGVAQSPEGWAVVFRDADGRPEIIEDPARRWFAMMHHPERESPFAEDDVLLFRRWIRGEPSCAP